MSGVVNEETQAAGLATMVNSSHPEVMVVTTNDLPGHEVVEIYGAVFGLTVRSRNLIKNIGADLKSLVGGELGALSNNMEQARLDAVDRLVGHAMGLHANAGASRPKPLAVDRLIQFKLVLALRFDVTTSGAGGSNIAVTAVSFK